MNNLKLILIPGFCSSLSSIRQNLKEQKILPEIEILGTHFEFWDHRPAKDNMFIHKFIDIFIFLDNSKTQEFFLKGQLSFF